MKIQKKFNYQVGSSGTFRAEELIQIKEELLEIYQQLNINDGDDILIVDKFHQFNGGLIDLQINDDFEVYVTIPDFITGQKDFNFRSNLRLDNKEIKIFANDTYAGKIKVTCKVHDVIGFSLDTNNIVIPSSFLDMTAVGKKLGEYQTRLNTYNQEITEMRTSNNFISTEEEQGKADIIKLYDDASDLLENSKTIYNTAFEDYLDGQTYIDKKDEILTKKDTASDYDETHLKDKFNEEESYGLVMNKTYNTSRVDTDLINNVEAQTSKEDTISDLNTKYTTEVDTLTDKVNDAKNAYQGFYDFLDSSDYSGPLDDFEQLANSGNFGGNEDYTKANNFERAVSYDYETDLNTLSDLNSTYTNRLNEVETKGKATYSALDKLYGVNVSLDDLYDKTKDVDFLSLYGFSDDVRDNIISEGNTVITGINNSGITGYFKDSTITGFDNIILKYNDSELTLTATGLLNDRGYFYGNINNLDENAIAVNIPTADEVQNVDDGVSKLDYTERSVSEVTAPSSNVSDYFEFYGSSYANQFGVYNVEAGNALRYLDGKYSNFPTIIKGLSSVDVAGHSKNFGEVGIKNNILYDADGKIIYNASNYSVLTIGVDGRVICLTIDDSKMNFWEVTNKPLLSPLSPSYESIDDTLDSLDRNDEVPEGEAIHLVIEGEDEVELTAQDTVDPSYYIVTIKNGYAGRFIAFNNGHEYLLKRDSALLFKVTPQDGEGQAVVLLNQRTRYEENISIDQITATTASLSNLGSVDISAYNIANKSDCDKVVFKESDGLTLVYLDDGDKTLIFTKPVAGSFSSFNTPIVNLIASGTALIDVGLTMYSETDYNVRNKYSYYFTSDKKLHNTDGTLVAQYFTTGTPEGIGGKAADDDTPTFRISSAITNTYNNFKVLSMNDSFDEVTTGSSVVKSKLLFRYR